ncbi:hypothetical protein VP01_953g10 [Puccinia sorghi]|uniref:MICOS complex subunit MIC10 n=1 Tax=Puccinia sorghi TaxID=27349 RepID=A0A0L6U6U9_9BASI|nr:hypothetical protein VP01_953g10 [Puccinia sorghi]
MRQERQLSMASSQRLSSSENILSEKVCFHHPRHLTDVCIANAIVKTGMGFGAGVIVSVLAFKRTRNLTFPCRRAFPVWIGIGSGLGASYSDCQRTFNPVHLPGYRFLDSPPNSTDRNSSPSANASCSLPPQKNAQNKPERML